MDRVVGCLVLGQSLQPCAHLARNSNCTYALQFPHFVYVESMQQGMHACNSTVQSGIPTSDPI